MQVVKARPSEQKVTYQRRSDVRKPLQYVRKVAFEQGGETIADSRLISDQSPPMLDQELQRARLFVVNPENETNS